MTSIILRKFAGMNPRRAAQKLPDNMSTDAANCLLLSGELRPLHKPSLLEKFYPSNSHQDNADKAGGG